MKAVICGAALTMAISLPTVAQEELKGCDAKAFALEQQIEYATVQGNQKRIDGLKRALAAIEDECSEEDLREKLQAEIEQFTDQPVSLFPDWETLPYDNFSPHQEIISDRIARLYQLPNQRGGVTIVPVSTVLQRQSPREFL
ncbi:DUF1090 family protein, partial [Vibrio sp. Vb0932]|uniref:DUF1090 domain-containing protein n=1 Tax=Vibrio sp. Vb0932 TaxID=3074633 RepID=UPI0029671195